MEPALCGQFLFDIVPWLFWRCQWLTH